MALLGNTFDKVKIDASEDAYLYHSMSDNTHWVGTYGERLKARTSGLNVYIGSGQFHFYGRAGRVEKEHLVTLQAHTEGVIVVEVDLSKTNTHENNPQDATYTWKNLQLQVRDKLKVDLKSEDLHAGGEQSDFILYEYKTTASTVNLVDKRVLTSPWDKVRTSIQAVNTRVDVLTDRVAQGETRITRLEGDLKVTNNNVTALGVRVQGVENSLSGIRTNISTLQSKDVAHDRDIQNLKDEIKSIDMGGTEIEGSINALNSRVTQVELRLVGVESRGQILSGTTPPTNAQGKNGDLYVVY